MNIYIDLEDERFVHLSSLLSHHFTIVDDIKDAQNVVLGIHKTEFIKEIKNKYIFSFCPMDECINLSENEDYLKKNAYLTALGCLSTLKDNYENIVIYGNGRIANYLNELLSYKAVLLARHPKDDEYLLEDHIYQKADLIINTIPARLPIDITLLKNDVKIIDLASYPYGFNHEALKSQGIDISLLSGIPGRMYPKTAACIIYQEVMKCLKD